MVELRAKDHKDTLRAERYPADFYSAWNTAEPDATRAAKEAG